MQNMIYPISHLPHVIPIGIQTSDNVNRIGFDVSAWLEKWPGMSVSVWHTLPGQDAAYEAESTLEGGILYWIIRAADTACEGSGIVEILGETADKRILSGKTATKIEGTSLVRTTDPPDAFQSWYERLLEKINASGGGSVTDPGTAHQMLVSDADGKAVWTDLLAYKTTGTVECLSETDLMGEDKDGDGVNDDFYLLTPWDVDPVVGGKYVVTYNGVAYECEGVAVPDMPEGVVGMGNLALLGHDGGNADVPFAMSCFPNALGPEAGVFGVFATSDGATSVTLSITGEVTMIKRIDPEYLPDSVGIQSVTQTTTSTEDGGENIVTVTKTDGSTSNFAVKNGSKGKDGYTPVKGTDYTDGKDGTSVTVSGVSESTEDGGTNVVTFSDGKTLNVRNGSKGKDGYTPVKGTDYFTAADKQTIVNDTISALAEADTSSAGVASLESRMTNTENNVSKLRIDHDDLENRANVYEEMIELMADEISEIELREEDQYENGHWIISPNGTVFRIKVNDDGTLYTEIDPDMN